MILIVVVVVVGAGSIFSLKDEVDNSRNNMVKTQSSMKITSTAFTQDEVIPSKYTCDGQNVNPPFLIEGVPKEAKELVFIFDDPDAPGGTWIHWIVWNISPETKEILENSVPVGAEEGMTSFGNMGYGGPCPHSGTHRYSFRVYALDRALNLQKGTVADEIKRQVNSSTIDNAEIAGLYSRKER